MSNVVSQAREAREKLAQGLAALQTPGVPPELMAVAVPVARAMAALHEIEASQGREIARAPLALDSVRGALAGLQTEDARVPAVDQAIAAVAGSLSLIHDLCVLSRAAAAAPVAAAAPPAARVASEAVREGAPLLGVPARPQVGAATIHQIAPTPEQPVARSEPTRAQPARPAVAVANPTSPAARPEPARQPAPRAEPQKQPVARAEPPRQPAAAAVPEPNPPTLPQGWRQPVTSYPPAAPGEPWRVEAALGAHSQTNFYKGLGTGDVIEAGGIFVATYQAPSVGEAVHLRIAMPGGYEFDAQGKVEWTRATSLSGTAGSPHAPPGFGARFTRITPEARQLVQRYVRNREPLFHDSL